MVEPSTVSRGRVGKGLIGLVLALVGSGGLIGLQVIVYGDSPQAERLQITLGLAGATLASAVAQLFLLFGGWLVWTAMRAPGAQRPPPANR